MKNSRLRILHVSPSYFPAHTFGGPIQSVHILNKNLSQFVDIEIFTTNAGLKKDKNIQPNKKTFLENIPITYFSFWGYEHFNFSIPLFFQLLFKVRNYDLVHITAVWNFPVWAASFACRLFKIPYIISPRGTIYPETIQMGSSKFKKIYLKYIAFSFLKNASAIHYTADDEKNKVEKFLNLNNGIVIANGISISENQTTLPFPEFIPQMDYILFLGRIDKKKGLDILIPAFSEVCKSYPNLLLIIAGPDSNGYIKDVENCIKTNQIEDKVILTGQILGNRKNQLFKHAKAFVLSSYSENFGMAVVEAMANNCPIVISNQVGIFDDIITFDAGIVTETTVNSVKNGILEVLNNSIKTNFNVKNALNLIKQKYEIGAVTNSFIDTYKNILNQK